MTRVERQEEPQQQGAPRVLAFEDDADEVA